MFRKYLITGLLVWVPLAITLWVLNLIIGTMDQSLRLLPEQWHPHTIIGYDVPGLGVVLTVLVVFVTGLLARNIIGERLVSWWEGLLGRIPIVRSIYSSVKQVSDTILSPNGQAFRKALLVQYSRAGCWTIAFQTGVPADEVRRVMSELATGGTPGTSDGLVSVYVPTTPNPTSGFFLMLPRAECAELGMSVDEALEYVVSMGVVAPVDRQGTRPGEGSAPH
jgi:uncharacterized membrane protein